MNIEKIKIELTKDKSSALANDIEKLLQKEKMANIEKVYFFKKIQK